MNYIQLKQAIIEYSENFEDSFIANVPRFVQEAEDRIYNSVHIPSLRKNVTGTMTASNPYLSLPDDWLSAYSVAVIDSTGTYTYLLNKDVNFMRESFPSQGYLGVPKYYSLFGSQLSYPNEMSLLVGPTPDDSYTVEMHYFYYPESIVQGMVISFDQPFSVGSGYVSGVYNNVPLIGGSGGNLTATFVVIGGAVSSLSINNPGSLYAVNDVVTVSNAYLGGTGSGFTATIDAVRNPNGTSWLGDNFDPVLLYGALREAVLYMKGEQDMVTYYEQKFAEGMAQLKRLGDGLERNDAYRAGQTSLPYNKL
jgi:hypothetical protein